MLILSILVRDNFHSTDRWRDSIGNSRQPHPHHHGHCWGKGYRDKWMSQGIVDERRRSSQQEQHYGQSNNCRKHHQNCSHSQQPHC